MTMNPETRSALVDVDRILTEAGWDNPRAAADALNDERIERLRSVYHQLLAGEHLAILDRTLGKNQTLREAGEQMGISEAAAAKLFREALFRLNEFAEVSSKA